MENWIKQNELILNKAKSATAIAGLILTLLFFVWFYFFPNDYLDEDNSFSLIERTVLMMVRILPFVLFIFNLPRTALVFAFLETAYRHFYFPIIDWAFFGGSIRNDYYFFLGFESLGVIVPQILLIALIQVFLKPGLVSIRLCLAALVFANSFFYSSFVFDEFFTLFDMLSSFRFGHIFLGATFALTLLLYQESSLKQTKKLARKSGYPVSV